MKQFVQLALQTLGLATSSRSTVEYPEQAPAGTWLQRDPHTRRWHAHALLTFEPGEPWAEPEFVENLYQQLAGCVVRVGLRSSLLRDEDLQSWCAGRNASALHATLAVEQARFGVQAQKLRRLEHYLWVSEPITGAAPDESLRALRALMPRVENVLTRGANHCHPVVDIPHFVQEYVALQDASGTQDSWTATLSLDAGVQAPLQGLARACGERLQGDFVMWSRFTLFADERRRQLLRRSCLQLARSYGQGQRDRFEELAQACIRGEVGEGGLQVSLLSPLTRSHDRTQLTSLAHQGGYRLESSRPGWLSWRAPRGRAPITLTEAGLLVPLGGPQGSSQLSPAGTLLCASGATALAFDPFASPANPNVLLVGSAGSGKSVASRALLLSHLAAGGAGWVIAEGPEADNLADAMQGCVVRLQLEDQGLNPLGACRSLDEVLRLRTWVASLLPSPPYVIEEYRHFRLEEAMARAWRQQPPCLDLGHVQQALREAGDAISLSMAEGLGPFVGAGSLAKLFSGAALDVAATPLKVFSLGDLPEDAVQLVSLTLAQLVSQHWHAARSAQRKMLVMACAEAWPVRANPAVGHLVERLQRGARACAGAFVWPLQSRMLDAGPGADNWQDSVRQHCGNAMLLKTPLEAIQALSPSFGLNKEWAHRWHWLNTSRQAGAEVLLLRAGQAPLVCRLQLEPLTLGLTSEWVPRVAAYRAARERGEAVLSALRAGAQAR